MTRTEAGRGLIQIARRRRVRGVTDVNNVEVHRKGIWGERNDENESRAWTYPRSEKREGKGKRKEEDM